jgi:hypothetical protein
MSAGGSTDATVPLKRTAALEDLTSGIDVRAQ